MCEPATTPPLGPLRRRRPCGAAEATRGGIETAHHAPLPTGTGGGAYQTALTFSDAYGGGDRDGGAADVSSDAAHTCPPRWVGGVGKRFRLTYEGWGGGLHAHIPTDGLAHTRFLAVGVADHLPPISAYLNGLDDAAQPVNNLLITCEQPIDNLADLAKSSVLVDAQNLLSIKRRYVFIVKTELLTYCFGGRFRYPHEAKPTWTVFQVPNEGGSGALNHRLGGGPGRSV